MSHKERSEQASQKEMYGSKKRHSAYLVDYAFESIGIHVQKPTGQDYGEDKELELKICCLLKRIELVVFRRIVGM